MKIFLSHAPKDGTLAHQLAELLVQGGFTVWLSEDQINPGDNWAKVTGDALEEAELMVLLLTPSAMKSESLRQNLEFALGSRKFEGRFFSVLVGPTWAVGEDAPWILFKLPHRIVESAKGFNDVIKDIQNLVQESPLSHAHA